ncbi:hypothetical protein C8R43DRAFT_1016399 [Mycena crocata]|nr:hypothetical protein C8R43DRAFT_1016399 [Mycena crocata]
MTSAPCLAAPPGGLLVLFVSACRDVTACYGTGCVPYIYFPRVRSLLVYSHETRALRPSIHYPTTPGFESCMPVGG